MACAQCSASGAPKLHYAMCKEWAGAPERRRRKVHFHRPTHVRIHNYTKENYKVRNVIKLNFFYRFNSTVKIKKFT